MAVDNFEKVKKLIHFEMPGDVYFAEVIARGKDFGKTGESLIRDFRIHSFEHFDELKPVIKELCDHYHARCYFRLNQRNTDELNSYLKIALEEQEILRKKALRNFFIAGCDKNRIHNLPKLSSASKVYSSVMGKHSSETRDTKKWIIDVDSDTEYKNIETAIDVYSKAVVEFCGKVYDLIPSKTGMHIVISPINKMRWAEKFMNCNLINEDGNTNLYIGD